VFFAVVLRRYSRTNKYTAAILAYVLGAGVVTVAAAPNFARLFKRQQEDEGARVAPPLHPLKQGRVKPGRGRTPNAAVAGLHVCTSAVDQAHGLAWHGSRERACAPMPASPPGRPGRAGGAQAPRARAGTYRQLQARLRTNAESVAFYGGIEKEGALIRRSFRALVAHQAALLTTQWRFSMWQARRSPRPLLCLKRVGGSCAAPVAPGERRAPASRPPPCLSSVRLRLHSALSGARPLVRACWHSSLRRQEGGDSLCATLQASTSMQFACALSRAGSGAPTVGAARQDFHTKYLAATVAVALIIGPFFAGHLRPVRAGRGPVTSVLDAVTTSNKTHSTHGVELVSDTAWDHCTLSYSTPPTLRTQWIAAGFRRCAETIPTLTQAARWRPPGRARTPGPAGGGEA